MCMPFSAVKKPQQCVRQDVLCSLRDVTTDLPWPYFIAVEHQLKEKFAQVLFVEPLHASVSVWVKYL